MPVGVLVPLALPVPVLPTVRETGRRAKVAVTEVAAVRG